MANEKLGVATEPPSESLL